MIVWEVIQNGTIQNFNNTVNDILNKLQEENCIIIDIKYARANHQSSILVMYEKGG
jgi:hypothetical protein